MRLLTVLAVAVASVASANDDFEDLQTEFILPYSETEDVDFHLSRPGGFGCWQWSTNNTDVIRLDPVNTDYERVCGNKLEFQILPGACKGEKTVILITAENVDLMGDSYDSDQPSVVEYVLRVHPVHHLEILGLKTELTAGSDPQPFGISGYDDEDNEFDTLDGLQISWYIGAKREIAIFERHRQAGPIVKVVPLKAGHGGILAVLNDPNYEDVEPAVMEFDVKAPLFLEPDGVFLLEGATVDFILKEKGLDSQGKETIGTLNFTAEDSEYKLELAELKEGEEPVVTMDPATKTVTAVAAGEGETTLFVKNSEGDVVKSCPVRVTTAHSAQVVERERPDAKQLILGSEYDIDIDVYDPDGRKIYPSENILCKTTFPKQFEVVEISENGLRAKVRAVSVGIGKIKASLRSVLTEDDEELEIVPHVKGSTDFEVYESVVIKPRETILPWDEVAKPSYELKYSATGGGKVYKYETDDEELGTADTEGKVTTHSGPGKFTVRASMVKGEQNYDEAKVYLLPVTHLELKQGVHLETSIGSPLTLGVRMMTFLADSGDDDPVLFTDCADVPYKVALSDNKNFEIESESIRGANRVYDACTSFGIKAKTPGTTCKVTVQYLEPSTSRMLKDSVHISAYRAMAVAYPYQEKNSKVTDREELLLPVGGTTVAVMRGGPTPWISKPSAHFTQVEVEDTDIIRVEKISAEEIGAPVISGSYSDVFAFRVTCLDVGKTSFGFMVGNTASATNKNPVQSHRDIEVRCDVPAKVVVKAEPRKAEHDTVAYAANPKNNRIMAHNYRDVLLRLSVKNAKGKTFHDISPLKFDFKISDEGLLKQTHQDFDITEVPVGEAGEYGKISYPGRVFQSFSPQSREGLVDIEATLVGYKEDVLKQRKTKTPPAIPRVPDDDEDDEDVEDEEEYFAHAHSLRDSVELQLARDAEINQAIRLGKK